MKCPDKDLTDGLRDMWEDLDAKERKSTYSNLCPECGSEMEVIKASDWGIWKTPYWLCECGHEEKVKP